MTFSRSSRHSTNCQLPGKKCSGTFRWIGLCVLYCCDTLPFNPIISDEKKKARRRPRLLADVDPHVGAGPAGNYPLSKRIGELDFSIVSTSICHVVHVLRKCYLPDTLRHLYTIGPFPRKSSLEGWLCLSCSDGLNTKNWRNVYLFYHHGGSGHGGGGQRRGSK